jgi:hypothetical protein
MSWCGLLPICQLISHTDIVQHRKYYEVEGQATKVALVVVLAKDEKTVLLDVVSNSSIQEVCMILILWTYVDRNFQFAHELFSFQNEWLFVVGECHKHAVRLPSKKEISRKIKMIEKYQDWVKDEVS